MKCVVQIYRGHFAVIYICTLQTCSTLQIVTPIFDSVYKSGAIADAGQGGSVWPRAGGSGRAWPHLTGKRQVCCNGGDHPGDSPWSHTP